MIPRTAHLTVLCVRHNNYTGSKVGKDSPMNQKLVTAIQTLVVAGASALVASGIFSDEQIAIWQPVVVAALGVLGAVGIHSLRSPK